MPINRGRAALLDIAKAARKVVQFKQGLNRESFLADEKTQSAIVFQLLILITGEAVKRLSQEFRSTHSDIPWTLIAGMRDTLIHEYDDIDLGEVWKTADRDIPELLVLLEPILIKMTG